MGGSSPARRLLDTLRRPGWRRVVLARRVGAGVLATLALVLALVPRAPGVPVVVTVRDVAAGSTLAAADVAVRAWPAGDVPAGAVAGVAAVEGRVLVGAARAGEPITDVRLAGSGLGALVDGGPDAAAVPVRLADADVAALLDPGSRVDVVTVGDAAGEPVVLAAGAAVLAVLPPSSGPGVRGRLVLVGMPARLAARVAAASLSEQVAITLR